ncbi:EAL domain-containing response regulator [Pseudomonas aeruginosa]|uniref:EAL domain-containing response regulator n=1 Tax=Pseudomonas aeruginosa TaxID=287 RepID=UPI000F52C28B|nr:EAL domain-containing response regulator [Pseudomonas aeruginosa]RQC55891.1 diguanylate phosphodiesterase [Pseudomonas aeruginosa]RQF50955.1 diguanylate phosphodiesterase [Pseudomonas aeruginosa]RQI29678.1 diguanylate phosphodiesterase [Pseudomonas aeruginosa]
MTAPLSCKVLIVDDQPFQLAYLRELFVRSGVLELHLASNGEEALRLLERESFSLLLSDLMMPKMDGVQLIQRLAETRNCPPLALMTSMPDRLLNNVANVAKTLGIDVIHQMTKPVTVEAVRLLLERLDAVDQPCRSQQARARRAYCPEQLEAALFEGRIQAWYQPKLHLSSGRVFAAEALVRWHHPEDGILMPTEFLPALEQAGLDEDLLFCILEQVVKTQIAWRAQGERIRVSLNLPGHLLDNPDLPDRLYSRVRVLGGWPGALVLEVTEKSTTSFPSSFHAAVCRLRMMGFGLSLDDFGKGYSSFCNLFAAPFTEIKFDRSLVSASVGDQACTNALASMVALAGQLGMEVVAEGVENQRELALMRGLKCDYVQGFVVAPALPAASLMQRLRKGSRAF